MRDFLESRDFYPRDSEFLTPGIDIFYLRGIPGIFHPRDRDVFSWDGISRQNATSGFKWLKSENKNLLFCVSEYDDIY